MTRANRIAARSSRNGCARGAAAATRRNMVMHRMDDAPRILVTDVTERRTPMPMPKDDLQQEYVSSWRTYVDSLDRALQKLEADIQEAAEMKDVCTDEWCQATEHVVDELSNALFSISEPRWSNQEDSAKIKQLKRRVHDLYADYRSVHSQAGTV
jgi:capsid protein